MTKARDISKLLSTANGKIAGENLDVSFENITDTGTEGTKVASGTTAQRGSTTGQLRFNTETNVAEYYDGTEFRIIETPPSITSIDTSLIDSNSGSTSSIVISGSFFASGATVLFLPSSGSNITPTSTTFNNSGSITVVVTDSDFVNANEPYSVKVTNPSGTSATLSNAINVDTTVAWQTASGSLGSINDDATGIHFTVSATDADSDTITYSVLSGSLPTGLFLNTNTGAISGDADDVGSSTTSNFTLRASTPDANADRSFSITVNPTPINIDFLVIAGGGSGTEGNGGGAGGGAGGYRTSTQSVSLGTVITITVGDGGADQPTGSTIGNAGSNSSISGSGLTTITSAGGGGGGYYSSGVGGNGGSGGGGGGGDTKAGGLGNTPSTTPSQGNNGGTGGGSPTYAGGGGGGAGGTGGNASAPNTGGNGGIGTVSSITGSSVTRAGGGGGGSEYNTKGTGGSGGGGNGGQPDTSATAGTVNTGGGGGGGGYPAPHRSGKAGGKGVVILSVPTANYSGTTTGSPTVTNNGIYKVLTFTGTGSYTV
jgi:hypothetical protein